MQELTQPLRDKFRENPGKKGILTTQTVDFEKDSPSQYHRQRDLLTLLCSIESDMKGAEGSIGGLFGM